jgi:hypothetical protein
VVTVLLLSTLLAVLNYAIHYDHGALTYDEGDYLTAVRNGFVTNWFDTDDISIREFVTTGLQAVKGAVDRGELSRMIRKRESSAFFRHQHPPLAFYPAMALRSIAPDLDPESHLRLSVLVVVLLWFLLMALLGLLKPNLFPSWLVLIPASANWMASVQAFNMHVLFGLMTLSFFLAWHAFSENRSQRWLRLLALGFLAGALCTVEYGTILLALLGLWVLIDLYRRRREWRSVLLARLKDLGWTILFFGMLWPAGVLKLGLLKSYAFQTYIALFRLDGTEGGLASFRDVIDTKWSTSPLEILLFMGAVGGMLWSWPKTIRRGSLFVSTLLVLAITYVQLTPDLVLPWYMFPAFAVAYGFFVSVLAKRTGASAVRQTAIAGASALILFGVAQLTLDIGMSRDTRYVRDAMLEISHEPVPTIVVQGMKPQLSAYLPDWNITGYHASDLGAPRYRDSLAIWSRTDILVLPEGLSTGRPGVDTIEGTVIYSPFK